LENLNLYFCTFNHILAYLIVLQYFVIIKTLEALNKFQFVPIPTTDNLLRRGLLQNQ